MNYELANDIKVTLSELGISATIILGKVVTPNHCVVKNAAVATDLRYGLIINNTTFFREGDIIAEFED